MRTRSENPGLYHAASLVAFLTATTICAGVVLVLASQTLPRMDDFCFASGSSLTASRSEIIVGRVGYGIWQYCKRHYYNWSGRLASVALEMFLLTSTPLPKSYPWLLLLVIAAQCFFVYIAIKQFLPDTPSALWLTILLACVYWANLPGVKGGMFWVTGNIENQLSVTLGLLL